MESSNNRSLIESLARENEEKVFQMSMIRLVAEATAQSLDESDYFSRICTNFADSFSASLCAFFWLRRREPSGWVLDSWTSCVESLSPVSELIPKDKEGILGWIADKDKPLYIEGLEDEAITQFWGPAVKPNMGFAMIPVKLDDITTGMFILIDPDLNISHNNRHRLLELLGNLIRSGVRNRLLYKKLYDSQEELSDLFENSSDMVVVAFPDGVIKDCNHIFKKKLKLKLDPCGCRIVDMIKKEQRGVFEECWSKLARGEEVRNEDFNLRCEDGDTVITELSGNARLDQENRVKAIRLYLRDVTEKRNIERKKRELELRFRLMHQRELAQLGLYTSGIVHNLQNPVHALLGSLELMQLQGAVEPELKTVEQSAQKILNIIDNLLNKLHRERNTDTVEINLNEMLQTELEFLDANLFFKQNVTKDIKLDENLPTIKGVYADFSQAIMNIIYNALDSMRDSEQKELTIRTEYNHEKDESVLSISDTGHGIREEIANQVLLPFFTTHNGNEADVHGLTSGSGLGLSTAVALLEPYGGKIHFESAPGEGATFFITL